MNVDHLLKQSCTLAAPEAADRTGKSAYPAGTATKCRFQKTSRIIQVNNTEKAPIDGVVWVSRNTAVDTSYKLTFAGIDYRVMMVSPMVDGKGATRHLEVLVQRWSL